MNFIDEVPDHIALLISKENDIAELKYMRSKKRGAANVWVRLAIDDRVEKLQKLK